MRQAFAGLLWSKQLYYYDVARWLDGDPTQPPPPPQRQDGRNTRWRNFNAFDIMSMPDKWEYPWFAAWDLAFHCVALAHVDPAFAKYQLILLCREWFQHPERGAAGLRVGLRRRQPAGPGLGRAGGVRHRRRPRHRLPEPGLRQAAGQLHLVGQPGGRRRLQLFEGGFLGLDNIGPIDRSHLPVGGILEQSDATGLDGLLRHRARHHGRHPEPAGQRPATDLVLKFLEHFAAISDALDSQGLWDEQTGCSTTGWCCRPARQVPVKVRSMVGIIPILAAGVIDEEELDRPWSLGKNFAGLPGPRRLDDPGKLRERGLIRGEPGDQRLLLGVVGVDRLERMLSPAVRRGRVPLAVRAAGPVRLSPRAPLRARRRGRQGHHRLRAGRVDHGDVRRQLQLARPGLVPAELPGHQRPWSGTTGSSGTS